MLEKTFSPDDSVWFEWMTEQKIDSVACICGTLLENNSVKKQDKTGADERH